MMGTLGHHLERRRFPLAQAAESRDLDSVSHGCRESCEATARCGLFAVACLS
jgi:hypothetical protein